MKTFGYRISVMLALGTAMLMFINSPAFARSEYAISMRYLELTEVNFPFNPSAIATVRITGWPEFGVHTRWDISVSGLHCTGNHQQPDGHAEWTRQASYGLYINGLRMLTFNLGCTQNSGFGQFKTFLEVFVPLPFDPFIDNLVGEVVIENDDGWDSCGHPPCADALLRGEDIFGP